MTRMAIRHFSGRRMALSVIAAFAASLLIFTALPAQAVTDDDFNLQLSPATLEATVKPGVSTTLDLKIRNNSSTVENGLKVETRDFSVDKKDQSIKLGDSTPPDLAQWVSYSQPTFSLQPNESITQKITINLPDKAGFSYPFAVVISRSDGIPAVESGRLIKASVAVFALVNVDKPGATRNFEIADFKTSQAIYDYLPAELELTLHNTGNTIVQPYGNFYVQRGSTDSDPLAVMPINQDRGYILPDTDRTFKAVWNDGFHRYKTTSPDGKERENLTWDWGNLSKLRIGKYTAKVVAVYTDGRRDIPVISEVSFWVFPWKFVLAVSIVILLILFGIGTVIRASIRATKKVSGKVTKRID